MADIKFSEFPKATTSKDTDEIAILQDGVNKMIPSPVLESKIINKTVTRVINQGGASLNVINLQGVVPTYSDLATITPTPELNDAYQVEADGLVYVYTESGFQADGNGFVVQAEPNGVVEEDNPNAVSGGEVYNNIFSLENNSLSYKYTGTENALKFTKLVKNIYIETEYNDISVYYIGINNITYQKVLIMLKSNGKLASFILNPNDIRDLKGKTIELLEKEEDVDFRESTRVWIEFNDIDFPTSAEFSFLQLEPNFIFYKNAFDYKNISNTYMLNVSSVRNTSLNEFYRLVENIYVVSKNTDINENNLTFNSVYINQLGGQHKLVLFFNYDSKNLIFYTKQPIISGSKRVKLEFKELEALNGYDVYVDFKDFGEYPTNEYDFMGINLKLKKPAFENQELLNKQNIELIESSGIILKTTTINVSKEADGNNAVQLALNSITDNSENNRYIINVANGLYEIHKKEDFIGNPGYPAMICPKDHVDIIGQGKDSTILWADLTESPTEPIDLYQTIYNWANDCTISNITFVCKKIRYTLHQDNGQESNGTRYYDNVDFIFLGNGGYFRALGMGTFSGSKTFFTNCASESQVVSSYSVHNNRNFSKPSLHSFKNHRFSVLNSYTNLFIYNCGSNQPCEVYLENSSFNGSFVVHYEEYWLYLQNVNDHFNHANWVVKGVNNQPFYFKNTVIGSTLCIETISKTKNDKIRFDINSTAYDVIVKNRLNYFGNLGNPNRKIEDGYVIQDGANGVSAFAFGGKSILEQYYFPDGGGSWTQKEDSLGKRLGNCTSNPIYLDVLINDVRYTFLFNQDYSNKTNAEIISYMNAVVGSVAIVKEYNIGADYYAEMTDVVSIEINNSTTNMIPKGTLVTKVGSKIKPCQENEPIYGLLIDDLGAYELDAQGVVTSKARVIKNCYVSVDTENVSSVLFSGTGSRYKVNNGVFEIDANGKYYAIDNKYILI